MLTITTDFNRIGFSTHATGTGGSDLTDGGDWLLSTDECGVPPAAFGLWSGSIDIDRHPRTAPGRQRAFRPPAKAANRPSAAVPESR